MNDATIQMTRSQWRAIPRDDRLYSRKNRQRYVVQRSSHGAWLRPVVITS